jgi:hypothetical protein
VEVVVRPFPAMVSEVNKRVCLLDVGLAPLSAKLSMYHI